MPIDTDIDTGIAHPQRGVATVPPGPSSNIVPSISSDSLTKEENQAEAIDE